MKIAIQGHPTRGKEVIQILESLGGKNGYDQLGSNKNFVYFITNAGLIYSVTPQMCSNECKIYTLEEFEKEFPFKIGDEVMFPVKIGWVSGKITGLTYREDQLKYEVDVRTSGYHYVESHKLQLYQMIKERNITLTLDKAKEWYKKGGELKEIALQAFTEKELTKVELPKTWEEFCDNYPVKGSEAMIGCDARIINCIGIEGKRSYKFKDIIPSKQSAEAHLAMMQLEQLRDCWWNGWEPDWNDDQQPKYCVAYYYREFQIRALYEVRYFLSFPTREMAEEFLECFRDLIEQAGDLI
jgi:hypothetical protein